MSNLYHLLECSPVIATVTDWGSLEKAASSSCEAVLISFGTLLDLHKIAAPLQAAGKSVIAHLELIDGFSSKEIAVDVLLMRCHVDAIISTKAAHIRRARQCGIDGILRTFMIDSRSYSNAASQTACKPDFIEIEPGIMPKVISKMKNDIGLPVISSGFITDKNEIISALSAGALAVSTSQSSLWNM